MLHSSLYMAFGRLTNASCFISGMDWRYVHRRLKEHERSMDHRTCAGAYFLKASESDIKSLLSGCQLTSHREQLKDKNQVLESVVDVMKVIGKRGFSYKSRNNAAW